MSVKIRLTRLGDKHAPFYRVVVADSRKGRDAAVIENIGTFNPLTNPAEIKINKELAEQWIKNGAQPTDTAKQILKQAGVVVPTSKAKTTKPTIMKTAKKKK